MLMIFDCDGVLVDSETIAARVLDAYLRDLGYPACAAGDAHARFVGLRLDAVRQILEAETGQALPAEFEDELRRRDFIAFETELMPIAGVADAIDALNRPCCVASSGSLKKIRNSLRLTGLAAKFGPHLFSAQDERVARGKPAPDLFLLAAREMGVEPQACIVIEDSAPGVQAGKAAGMRVLGFGGGGHCGAGHLEKLSAAGADAVFDDMARLIDLV